MSNNITISDVAEALGVSKTTVSRAISGKGRIGAATRKRVLEYIQEHDYKPNVIARGLAQSKTFNICVVMPGDYALVDLPFFQEAIMGIQEIAGMMEYDLLLCIGSGNDMAGLRRIIQNHKVMFDEAFNNMDDERIGAVLEFMNRLPLQIVIAAPPDKIQYIGPKMQETLLVLTDDKVSFVEEYRYASGRK